MKLNGTALDIFCPQHYKKEGKEGRREGGEREEGRSEGGEGKGREVKGHNKMNICIKIICAIT